MPTGSSADGSGRPVAAKLGLSAGQATLLVAAPAGWVPEGLPAGVSLRRRRSASPADVVICFVRSRADLAARTGTLPAVLGPATALWLLWPRRAAGHVSDLGDVVVRAAGLSLGLVDVKVAAVGEDWSGLRFVRRRTPAG